MQNIYSRLEDFDDQIPPTCMLKRNRNCLFDLVRIDTIMMEIETSETYVGH